MPRKTRIKKRKRRKLPRLKIKQILEWADLWHESTNNWPTRMSGNIPWAEGLSWLKVDDALRCGRRGLSGGSSIRRLLAQRRGVRSRWDLPRHKIRDILRWADAYHERFGRWPALNSGRIAEAPEESWSRINRALQFGRRGLKGYLSLAHLLELKRGKRRQSALPPMCEAQIARWADAFHERTGRWPNRKSDPILEAPGETWLAVENALREGLRGLPGGSSLVQLLMHYRGIRRAKRPPRLTVAQILDWADAYHERTGHWPIKGPEPVAGLPGETWAGIDSALRYGHRGLGVRTTLAGLLASERSKRHLSLLPPLSVNKILQWADEFHAQAGRWPRRSDGKIPGSDGESWFTVDLALRNGLRGLTGKSSLSLLLSRNRGIRSHMHLRPLTIPQILEWARAYEKRHGKRPSRYSGPIPEMPGENWQAVHMALRQGGRGLPGGTTLAKLLKAQQLPSDAAS